jgi:predicted dehydrogenase/threonine dehydrogenase-like Zn-dependent dehydrogenase
MRQIIQNMSSGETQLVEAPAPEVTPGTVLIATRRSLISAGTERMLVDFGRSNLIAKARKQPEKVRQVLDKARTDGALSTLSAVRAKLGQPLPLGYCNAGTVVAIGQGVTGLATGDRVASNGPHADIVCVPQNLCARIPDGVSDDTAAFTVLASIGLQGIRLAQPTLGETFVVTGVGLIGLITVQLLRAQGCRVMAIDFDQRKLDLAATFGAQTCNPGLGADPVAASMAFSRGRGVDGVIITASTSSNDPVSQAAKMARARGRIILVGVTGLNLNRADFYEKELSFQVSCSYGPGRYDPSYEQAGNDYPFGLVRWTEQRNFEAVLDMMDSLQLTTDALISHRINFDDATSAYEVLTNNAASLGIVLEYPIDVGEMALSRTIRLGGPDKKAASSKSVSSEVIVGFVGAGNYASRILIPAFKSGGATLKTLATNGGLSSVIQGKSLGFMEATSDVETVVADPNINAVVVVTRHDSHAGLVVRALNAGKHVFVEKPLALSLDELADVEECWSKQQKSDPTRKLMVGFNRRFAPQVVRMKSLIAAIVEPKSFVFTVNAGAIPANHWTQDPKIGGGRIVGEACHFIDLMRFLAGARIKSWQLQAMGNGHGVLVTDDKVSISLTFDDGSFGTIHYLANGSNVFPKERLEVFASGHILQIDNFRKMHGFGWPGFRSMNLWRQDKGQAAAVASFLGAVRDGGPCPIPIEDLFEVARVTIEVANAARG